ncbi:platelet binding protein GspB [Anabrus simplex]|uniref:platelet binding protein GspB n=1 Tax=Anabrus simplex TaxID=316456 RepID=UPI0035A3A072
MCVTDKITKDLLRKLLNMRCRICELLMDQQQSINAVNHHHLHDSQPQLQQTNVPLTPASLFLLPQFRDMVLAAYLLRGYYQPAGPLISTHHHHHHSTSSSVVNTGKAPAVLTTLESSATPTPPPSAAASHATSSGTTRGGGTGGDESSDNDVIITATSCSSAGEVAPPPSLTQPPPPSAAHHTSYRYAQSSYPPPPTPSTPQHPLHQSYSYSYPHTQYYPSPPSSASIQYSSVVTNPQHHSHYHNQDLCYSGAASNYPPASYFHHKSYSTPPPPPSYRRYIPAPPPHHSQYYPPDLYSTPSSGSVGQQQSQSQQQQQQGSQQQQQSQQMVVTASTGAVSSYQPPPPAPPAPPALVETYPPPPSIVDPYPPPYYTSYSAGPGAPGCYTHSPPTRSLAFIDAPYQSCPCPMQSCPKNVLTGPLTGDGKGPHTKQPQQHVPPLPPVALALPLEPPGAMGPPSPARGSAGMPPPPSPASASARTDDQTKPSGSLTVLSASTEDAIVNNGDGLLTISKMNSSPVPPPTTVLHCDTEVTKKMKQTAVAVKVDSSEPTQTSDSDLLQQKTQDIVTQTDFPVVLDPKENSVKVETSSSPEVQVLPVIEKSSPPQLPSSGEDSTQTPVLSSSLPTSRKRQLSSDSSPPKSAANSAVTKRRKTSSSSGGISAGEELSQDSVVETIESEQHPPEDTASKTSPKCPPVLSSNSSNSSIPLSSAKQRKRKLEDGSKSSETAPTPAKVISRVQSSEAKTYPSRTKPGKNGKTSNSKLTAPEALDRILHKNQTVCDSATAAVLKKNGISVGKKLPNGKILGKKALEKVNGSLCHQPLKKVLRQLSAQQPDSNAVCVNEHVVAQMMSNGNNSKSCTEKAGHRRKALEASAARKSNKSNNMLRRQSLREPSPDQISEEGVEVETSKVKARRLSSGSKKETSTAKKTASVVSSSKLNGEVRSSAKKQQLLQQQLQDLVMPTTHPDIYAMKKTMMKKPLPTLKWSNGWSWEGEPFWARVFLTSDDVAGARKCYPAMRHTEGDVIRPRDCVLLKSGPRKTDLPFVAKVAGLWENPDDGEMMVSLLWYYRPEHTDQGRRPEDMEDEIFASKHKDINSVACIEDKCYVLTFNEYCRYRKCVRRLEEGVREPGLVVPEYEGYPRRSRQPPGRVASDMVFFCRRVYDFRQRRILKNPG